MLTILELGVSINMKITNKNQKINVWDIETEYHVARLSCLLKNNIDDSFILCRTFNFTYLNKKGGMNIQNYSATPLQRGIILSYYKRK